MKAETKDIHSQRSWIIGNDQVELAVTRLGAHMAPVVFSRDGDPPLQPYYISPWQDEGRTPPCPVLEPLRGDFFCLPFGGNATPFRGEKHPPHGESAGSLYRLLDCGCDQGVTTLAVECETKVRPGRVTRRFSLMDGHPAVYSTTTMDGFSGKTPMGHHAILAMPEKEKSVLISMSPFQIGMTCPHLFSNPDNGEHQSLVIGASFDCLSRVPTLLKEEPVTDCSVFPARRGYADLVGLFEDPAKVKNQPSWAVAVNTVDHWLWFSLKDARILPARLIWTENRGRKGSPWNGRNCCMALEDGCLYFDAGVAESCGENLLSRRGIPTCHELTEGVPFSVNYIQGAVRVPRGFGRVSGVEFGADQVTFVTADGQRAVVRVRHSFLADGKL